MRRENLTKMRALHQRGQAARTFAVWEVLLQQPLDVLLAALLATTQEGRDLRANSVMAGVLGQEERRAVLGAFYEHEQGGHVEDPSSAERAEGARRG